MMFLIQEPNSEGSEEERLLDNVNKTVPKENSADKVLEILILKGCLKTS